MTEFKRNPKGYWEAIQSLKNLFTEALGRGDPTAYQAEKLLRRLGKRSGFSFEDIHTNIGARQRLPEVIMDPSNRGETDRRVYNPTHGMLHFPADDIHPAMTYSTGGQLNPQTMTLPSGVKLWDHDNFLLSTVGINPATGFLCDNDGCALRAILNATGAQVDYNDLRRVVKRDGWLNEREGQGGVGVWKANQLMEDHFDVAGLAQSLDLYPGRNTRTILELALRRQPREDIDRGFDVVQTHDGVLSLLGMIRGRPAAHMHGIGFHDGRHVRSSLYENFNPDNVWAVTEAHIP